MDRIIVKATDQDGHREPVGPGQNMPRWWPVSAVGPTVARGLMLRDDPNAVWSTWTKVPATPLNRLRRWWRDRLYQRNLARRTAAQDRIAARLAAKFDAAPDPRVGAVTLKPIEEDGTYR